MDPNTNIKRQRELANVIIDGHASGEPAYSEDDVIDLAELVIALDQWLAAGGFRPARWTHELDDDERKVLEQALADYGEGVERNCDDEGLKEFLDTQIETISRKVLGR